MNRAERRRQERRNNKTVDKEIEKYRKLFSKFSHDDFRLIEDVMESKVATILDESSYVLDMIYSSELSDLGFRWEQIEEFNSRVSEKFKQDVISIQKLKSKFGEEYEKEMAKISEAVEKRIRELIENKTSKKEAIDILLEENPLLTKSMLTNVYSKINAEIKKQQENQELDEDTEIKEATEKIVGIIEGEKGMNDKKETKNELKADTVVKGATETNLTSQIKGLKVLEEKVVKTVKIKGENGIYEAETGKGVSLNNDGMTVYFKTEEQLNNWVSEIRQVFSMI